MDTVETAIYRLRVEGQDQIDKLTKSIDGLATAETKATASTRTTSEELQKQLARADPLLRAQQKYSNELERIYRFQQTGIGTQQEINALLEANTARYQKSVAAMEAAAKATTGLAEAHKGLNAQGQAAFHSVRSVVEQLALGVPITQTLTGQLNHLAFAATGEGGISGAFKQVGSALGGLAAMVSPIGAVTAGVAALAAGVAALALAFDKAQVSAQRAIGGTGARTGTTISDINRFTEQQAAPLGSGTGLSQKETRALGESLTQTGEIVISKLHDMSNAVMGFANQTGKSVDEAIKDFARFGTDPIKALDELEKAFGFVSPQARKMVEDLVIAGDKTGAFQAALNAVSEESKRAAANMGVLEKAWRAVVNALAIETVKPRGIEQQIEQTKKAIDATIQFAGTMPGGQASAQIATLTEAWIKLNEQLDKGSAKTAAAQINDLANKARLATDAVIPQIEQLKQLETRLNQLKEAQAAGQGPDTSAAITATQNLIQLTSAAKDEAARYNDRVAVIAKSWGEVSQATALELEKLKDQLPVIQAITGEQKMAAQAALDYKTAIDAGKSALDAAELAAGKLAQSQAAATAAVEQQNKQQQQSNELAKVQGTSAEKSVAAMQAYNNALESGADDAAAHAAYAVTIDKYTASAAKNEEAAAEKTRKAREEAARLDLEYRRTIFAAQAVADTTDIIAENTARAAKSAADFARAMQLGTFAPNVMPTGPLTFAGGAHVSYPGGATGKILSLPGFDFLTKQTLAESTSGYLRPATDTKAAADKAVADAMAPFELQLARAQASRDVGGQMAALQGELGLARGMPETADKYQKITALQNAIEQLIKSTEDLSGSTDSLNRTNSELLSPYYTTDPRLTHIGFRSQGMALGGYVDVPGVYSRNDNMIAQIPVASGERIYVDPMGSRRGGSGKQSGGQTNHFAVAMNFYGPTDKDAVGRTAYQSMQLAAKQMAVVR